MPVARGWSRWYFIGMVRPISQPSDVSLRSSSALENVLGGSFLVAFGLRSYNPELGRWINRDPIGENGGINLLLILANNIQNKIDFIGLALLPPPDFRPPEVDIPMPPAPGFPLPPITTPPSLPAPWIPTPNPNPKETECCGGKPYDPLKKCCCKGNNLIDKAAPLSWYGKCQYIGGGYGGGAGFISCFVETGTVESISASIGAGAFTFEKGCTSDCKLYSAEIFTFVAGLSTPGVSIIAFSTVFSGAYKPADFTPGAALMTAGASGPIGGSLGILKLGSAVSAGLSWSAGLDLGAEVFTGICWVHDSVDLCQAVK